MHPRRPARQRFRVIAPHRRERQPLSEPRRCSKCGLAWIASGRSYHCHSPRSCGQTVLVLGSLVSVVLSGFLIGALARLALPGPDPLPFALTVLLGLAGALVGGGIAAALFGAKRVVDGSGHAFVTLLLEVAAAVAILAFYRRFVQRRPLTGPGAYSFPVRGFGIERMRGRLRRFGVDPDRIGRRPVRGAAGRPDLTPDEQADELEKLRDLHDSGALTDEEYERARERLRRY